MTKKRAKKSPAKKKAVMVAETLRTHSLSHDIAPLPTIKPTARKASALIRTASIIDYFNLKLGHALAWLSLAMVVLMAIVVLLRYLFSISHTWQQELILYFHAILFMGASSYTLLREGHVRVDVLYQYFHEKSKAKANLFGTVIFLFPCCWALFYFSREFIFNSWGLLEGSAEYDGLPGVFLIKTLIWVFAGLLALQGVSTVCRSVETLKGTTR